jgi:hypothetical protein
MTRVLTLGSVLTAAWLLSACAAHPTTYNWGTYNTSLYAYYKDPAKVDALLASMQAIIDGAAKGKGAIPPGIYAEYGYLQMQRGNDAAAVAAFQQEKQHWPESTVFMDQMLKLVASTKTSPTNTVAPPQ